MGRRMQERPFLRQPVDVHGTIPLSDNGNLGHVKIVRIIHIELATPFETLANGGKIILQGQYEAPDDLCPTNCGAIRISTIREMVSNHVMASSPVRLVAGSRISVPEIVV